MKKKSEPPKETALVWPVREAKSRLSEILRRARTDGPQTIGTRNPCVVIPKETWSEMTEPKVTFTEWLIENSPGIELEIPPRDRSPGRKTPFEDIDL